MTLCKLLMWKMDLGNARYHMKDWYLTFGGSKWLHRYAKMFLLSFMCISCESIPHIHVHYDVRSAKNDLSNVFVTLKTCSDSCNPPKKLSSTNSAGTLLGLLFSVRESLAHGRGHFCPHSLLPWLCLPAVQIAESFSSVSSWLQRGHDVPWKKWNRLKTIKTCFLTDLSPLWEQSIKAPPLIAKFIYQTSSSHRPAMYFPRLEAGVWVGCCAWMFHDHVGAVLRNWLVWNTMICYSSHY